MRDEPIAADLIEHVAPDVVGRPLGHRTCRDAKDGSGILVDFTYDEVDPPVALEVTGLHVRKERELLGAMEKKLEPQLTALAEQEQLGGWQITLEGTADVKALLLELPDLIREGRSFRPNDYTSDDLISHGAAVKAFVEKHRRFAALGLVDAERLSDENGVRALAFSIETEISGFHDDLDHAIKDNISKLRVLDRYETHLAVLVYDFHASRQSERTSPPELPAGLDRLWVLHSWPEKPGFVDVWTVPRGQGAWTISRVPSTELR